LSWPKSELYGGGGGAQCSMGFVDGTWPALEAARDASEGRQALLAGGTDELRDPRLAVDVGRTCLGVGADLVDGPGASVEHLTVAQLETEVGVDVDRRRLKNSIRSSDRRYLFGLYYYYIM